MKNALSIDLEDWFCVHNLAQAIKRDEWDQCDLRVRNNTMRILNLLDQRKVRATFFILGWVADRAPDLIREVEARGHEIGVHGYNHLLLPETHPAPRPSVSYFFLWRWRPPPVPGIGFAK